MSNPDLFKYEWIWEKNRTVGFLNAKNAPLKKHESVLVFSKGTIANGSKRRINYFPQGLKVINKVKNSVKQNNDTVVWSRPSRGKPYIAKHSGYPNSILNFNNESKQLHPTQKPVALFEYLVKTYTNKGDTVLDNCMGSGTTAIACLNAERNFIGFELNEEYYNMSLKRISENE